MKTFKTLNVPSDPKALPQFLWDLQRQVEQAAQRADSHASFQVLGVAPAKVSEGMVVLADGTNWDPGLGEGMYRRTSTGWKRVDPYTGTVTLVAGTKTVSLSAITANSRIYLTSQVDGGTPGSLRVSSRTPGVGFTITSSSATDTSTVAYQVIEP